MSHESADGDRAIGAERLEMTDVAGGCLMSGLSVTLSCGLLIINGALVMAVLTALSAGGLEWFSGPKASQFILFTGPLALLIIQWVLIDTLRWILRRRQQKVI